MKRLLIFLCFFAPATYSAISELVFDYDKNEILKALPFPLEEALNHPEELRVICEKLRARQGPSEATSHINAVSHILLSRRYSDCISRKDAAKEFDRLITLEWDIFRSVPSQLFVQQLQRRAFSLGKKDLVKHIFCTFVKQFVEFQKILGSFTPTFEMAEKDINDADAFILDYKQRPDVHRDLMNELISVPTEFNEVIAYCTKQIFERVGMLKRTLEMVKSLKTKEMPQMLHRFCISSNLKIIIGAASTLFHNFLAIKRSSGNRRKELIDEILIDLTVTLGIFEYKLPAPLIPYLEGFEPFSQEWIYLKFRLFSFACHSFFTDTVLMPHLLDEIRAQEPLSFILLSRVITALLPFSSNFGKSSVPFVVFDPVNDPAYFKSTLLVQCMQEKMGVIATAIKMPRRQQPSVASIQANFYRSSLPNAFMQCVVETGSEIFLDPTEADIKELLTQSAKTRKKTRKPRARKPASTVQEFDVVPLPEPLEPVAPEPVEIKDELVQIEEEPEQVLNPSPPRQVNFKELMKPRAIPIEYDRDEVEKWTLIYQKEIEHYNLLVEDLEELPAEDLEKPQSLKIVSLPETLDKKKCFVAKWSTQDFLELCPEAAKLYYQNVSDCTSIKALHKKNLRFEWIFDVRIKIDSKTFRFLSQVFGLQPGEKDLTFRNFQRSFILLNGGSSQETCSKNRTVFSFRHAFVVDHRIAVLPIRGVHPEHLSSRFNHVQVKGFLENGGFHPYFFRLID